MRKRGLYGQTVTVYHPVPMKKRVDRYVLRGVFCQIGSREVPDAAGAKSGAVMLLVVPETDVTRYRRVGGVAVLCASRGGRPGYDNLRTAVIFARDGAPCGSRGLVECRWSGRRAAGKVNKKG